MLNHYPLWKYILIIFIVLIGAFYALPNIYGEDPALQVAASARGVVIDEQTLSKVVKTFEKEGVHYRNAKLSEKGLFFRFENEAIQLKAKKVAEILPGKNKVQVFKNFGTAMIKYNDTDIINGFKNDKDDLND